MTHVSSACRARRPQWLAVLVAVLAAAGIMLLSSAPAAQASGVGETMNSYQATYTLAKDGSVRVELAFDYTIGANGGHGPLVRVPVQVATDDPAKDRLYPISDITAASPSGAPANVTTKLRHGVMSIYVGDPKRTVHGTQSYLVSYTQQGVINHVGDRDEFYWNVLAEPDFWVTNATALVRAPGPAAEVTCYQGERGSTSACSDATMTLSEDIADGTALPAYDGLTPAEGDAAFWSMIIPSDEHLTIDVVYPKGTFPNSPILTADPKERTKYVFEWDRLTISIAIGGGAVLLGLLALVGRFLARRVGVGPAGRARDRLPDMTAGSPLVSAAASRASGAGLRSQPPGDIAPGEAAILTTGQPGPNDLAVRLADLAQRGVITLAPLDPPGVPASDDIAGQIARAVAIATRGQDWRLTSRPVAAGFTPTYAERALLEGLFTSSGDVTLRTFGQRQLALVERAMNRGAIRDVAAKHWFRPGFRISQRVWPLAVLALLIYIASMVGVGFVADTWGVGPWFIAMGGLFAMVILLLIALRAPAPRSRKGAAAFEQLQDYKAYLAEACSGRRPVVAADAEASPWAIALGLAAPFAAATEPISRRSTSRATTYPWWLFTSHGVSDVRSSAMPVSSGDGSSGSSGASGSSGSSGSGSAGGGGGGTSVGGW